MATSTNDLPEVPDGCQWPIVLGIDPGTRLLGFGALVLRRSGPRLLTAGLIRAPRTKDVARRLGFIRREVDVLLARVKPTVVVIEEAFAALNVQSALRIGEGRGVVLAASACTQAEIVQYPPAVAKKALVGNGAADKAQVAAMVAAELGLSEPPGALDTTDALALALAYIHKHRYERTLTRGENER